MTVMNSGGLCVPLALWSGVRGRTMMIVAKGVPGTQACGESNAVVVLLDTRPVLGFFNQPGYSSLGRGIARQARQKVNL